MPREPKAHRSGAGHAAGQEQVGLQSLPQELLSNILRKAAAQSDKYPTALFEMVCRELLHLACCPVITGPLTAVIILSCRPRHARSSTLSWR